MAVVREFTLPDLGEGLTEAEIVRWLVEVGDVVAVDQPVVEVETAKAMVEVPCPYGGVVTARFGEEGSERPVGSPLLTVAVGERPGGGSGSGAGGGGAGSGVGDVAGSGDGAGAGAGGDAAGGEGSGNVLVGYGTAAPAARRRRLRPAASIPASVSAASVPAASVPAGQLPVNGGGSGPDRAVGLTGTDTGSGTGTGSGERSVMGAGSAAGTATAATAAAAASGPLAVISPLVRRIARESGVDLREVSGSGPEGLILRSDVEGAVRRRSARESTEPVGSVPAAPGAASGREREGERVPLRGVRGAVADKLARSRREIPDATCWVDADATELLAARAAMNAAEGPKVSLLAVLARICTAALARYPELNATVDADAREIVRLTGIHLGFAAQTDRGLVVPVVRDAQARDAVSLSEEIARLTEAARAGSLSPAELTGGTFTLNNYGVFGVDGSTPIINHPEAAMLGVGRIAAKPWVVNGELAVRRVVQLSFTFDHRVCDGGTAGGFLRYVADCVEQPAVLLRSL
ncbi:dihydrolipoamide acetyltransferase family protein [Streptomyces sp. NPDC050617]|uniref:dihydrolipoamide acetyltransferase family protein n=1 Tax=Streptomyces sp. NPDC050617 TaxID=3154628 RepID=UPI0034344831